MDCDTMRSRFSDYDSALELDVAAGSEAVGVVERKIRTVKERIRGHLSTLPYLLDEILEEWLVKNNVYMNLVRNSTRNSKILSEFL